MIWLIFIALVAQALLIKDKARSYCCSVFCAEAVFHHIIFSGTESGFLYFSTAAMGNLLVAILLMGLRPIVKTVLIIQTACLIGAILNFGGYVLWVNYYSVMPYNIAFFILYLAVLVCNFPCLSGSLNDDRNDATGKPDLDAVKISFFCLDYRSFIKNLIRVLQ